MPPKRSYKNRSHQLRGSLPPSRKAQIQEDRLPNSWSDAGPGFQPSRFSNCPFPRWIKKAKEFCDFGLFWIRLLSICLFCLFCWTVLVVICIAHLSYVSLFNPHSIPAKATSPVSRIKKKGAKRKTVKCAHKVRKPWRKYLHNTIHPFTRRRRGGKKRPLIPMKKLETIPEVDESEYTTDADRSTKDAKEMLHQSSATSPQTKAMDIKNSTPNFSRETTEIIRCSSKSSEPKQRIKPAGNNDEGLPVMDGQEDDSGNQKTNRRTKDAHIGSDSSKKSPQFNIPERKKEIPKPDNHGIIFILHIYNTLTVGALDKARFFQLTDKFSNLYDSLTDGNHVLTHK